MKKMLDANIHFGHQTNRWNPKMAKYIYTSKNGIYIIDIKKTIVQMKNAMNFIKNIASKREKILFIGTKKQARHAIMNYGSKCQHFFVHNRWLGGMLTNFNTIKKSIDKMKKLEELIYNGILNKRSKKEVSYLNKNIYKLKKNLLGVKNIKNIPSAIFVIDPNHEKNAINEALKLSIPIIAMTDTNCNPDLIAYPIPANDDSIKSIIFFLTKAIESCNEGEQLYLKRIKDKI